MKRGSTPKHTFDLPYSVELIDEIEITYKQESREVLRKFKDECELSGNSVSLVLTQDETFSFVEGIPVKIQIRVKDTDGNVIPSDVFTVTCDECLSDEVL